MQSYLRGHRGRLNRRVYLPVAALACASVLSVAKPAAGGTDTLATPVRIAVVKSLDLPQYNSAYEGFTTALKSTGYEPVSTTVTLEGGDAAIGEALRAVRDAHPDLILALGTRAAREVSRRERTIPIVYSMVLNSPPGFGFSAELRHQGNLTGASLNIPLAVQLEYLRTIFPAAHRVGVISNPSRTRVLVDSAMRVASAQGVELRVHWVHGEREIPDAVRALTDSIDVLWMIPDETVFTPRSSRYIIFELIKAGVPIMGLSSAYVKAGAVIALDCNYVDIGRQSGELAARVLAGQSPDTLAETVPRVFTLAVNTKVREHLRISMNESAIKKLDVITF